MANWTEPASALGAFGAFVVGAYSLYRSIGDKREEKSAELESRTTHIETFLEVVHEKFQRWRK